MDTILIGHGRSVIRESDEEWRRALQALRLGPNVRLSFMTPQHRQMREYAVTELPRVGRPITPGELAQRFTLSVDAVVDILAELERHLFFIRRNDNGDISWAFPVTVEPTPHRLRFDDGAEVFAA